MSDKQSLSYKDAGVDIDAGNELVERIKGVAKRTRRPGVLAGLGGFGALFEIPQGYREPVLVSGTDGVGTKLRLALDLKRHETIGIDLVAMCANDLVVAGAEPLFFLDYYATGKLNVEVAATVIEGIGQGCDLAGASLVGGETAEMPGMYEGEDYDLAGFCVGIVEKADIIDGSKVKAGDKLVAVASSGPHSNGYSLVRKIIEVSKANLEAKLDDGQVIADALMAPTRIYVKPALKLIGASDVHAMCHVTGGGFQENIPRVLPDNAKVVVDTNSWNWPAVFNWLQTQGGVATSEMFRTFNCGVGLIVVLPEDKADAAVALLNAEGEQAWVLGDVVARQGDEAQVEFVGQRAL